MTANRGTVIRLPVLDSFEEIQSLLNQAQELDQSYEIVTLNPEILLSSHQQSRHQPLFSDAAAVTLDSFYLTRKLAAAGIESKRYTGVDIVADCFSHYASTASFILYGAAPDIAAKVATQAKLSNARIFDGYNHSVEQVASACQGVSIRPDFCFVALGGNRQYEATRYLQETLHPRIIIACGGAFDVISGNLPRAPVWMRKIGMEWLFRVLLQPKRLPRQLNVFKGLALVGHYCRVVEPKTIELSVE